MSVIVAGMAKTNTYYPPTIYFALCQLQLLFRRFNKWNKLIIFTYHLIDLFLIDFSHLTMPTIFQI